MTVLCQQKRRWQDMVGRGGVMIALLQKFSLNLQSPLEQFLRVKVAASVERKFYVQGDIGPMLDTTHSVWFWIKFNPMKILLNDYYVYIDIVSFKKSSEVLIFFEIFPAGNIS